MIDSRFANDLRGPEPSDRFPWFIAALLAAVAVCGLIGWRMM